MTLPLELCGRERAGDSEAVEPLSTAVMLPIYTTTLSVFIIHISCCIRA